MKNKERKIVIASATMKKRKTPEQSIADGFWDAFGEWTPNTPAVMAKVALLALEREGYKVVQK